MTYLLDTNIILAYLKKSALSRFLDETYALLQPNSKPFISAVTVGELWSISLQNSWGQTRRNTLIEILRQVTIVDVNIEPLIQSYAQIDAFSQGKLTDRPLGDSARNMGKNDLWRSAVAVAATASLLDATLISTDKDFNHLHGHFLEVVWLDSDKYK
jgi:tRNA(fMet)-specific endonuclease VapC